MKYIVSLLFLFSFRVYAISEECVEARLINVRIVQKLDTHTYEVAMPYSMPDHLILITKKANFYSPGLIFGLKVQSTGKNIPVKLQNGFEQSYLVIKECGLLPLRLNGRYFPDVSERAFIKGFDKVPTLGNE